MRQSFGHFLVFGLTLQAFVNSFSTTRLPSLIRQQQPLSLMAGPDDEEMAEALRQTDKFLGEMKEMEGKDDQTGAFVASKTGQQDKRSPQKMADRDIGAMLYELRKSLNQNDFRRIFNKRNPFIGEDL